MKVTWNWLVEFVDIQLTEAQLAERLAMSGLEVESIDKSGRDLAGILCAEIVRVAPHPEGNRLHVCEVRTGPDATWPVVCGASNVQAGSRVAYAPSGATLPDGRQISTAEIRGVSSAGMLCSESELGIGDDTSGILILPSEAPIGQRVSAILGLEDTIFDIAVTPNRGDCLSVVGIAREIAALTGQHLRRQRVALREALPPTAEMIAVRVADPDLCGRYAARMLLNVKIAASPLWLQSRLLAVGLRPINNIVDVTNYVMIERGQPLHAFDYDRLPQPEIVVRRAGAATEFTTLDGQTRQLHPDDLMICAGEEPVAIAGIMGGADSEVTLSTQRVLLESAWFNPSAIRRTAKRLGLRSDASYRFERTTDIEGVLSASDRAAALMASLAGATVSQGRVDAYVSPRQPAPIALRLKRVSDLLGMEISRQEITARLKALELSVSPATRGTLTVLPPSHRSDLTREIDLIEEIARLGGYENVPTTLPESTLMGAGPSVDQRRQRDLKRFCAAQGLNEAVFLSFCSPRLNVIFPGLQNQPAPVRVLNPLTQEDSELRLSLLPGLLRIVRNNLDQGVANVAVFCLGKVFWNAPPFSEANRLAFAVCPALPSAGVGTRGANAEYVDVKGIVEALLEFVAVDDVKWSPLSEIEAFHPGKTGRIEVAGQPVGVLGALHPALEWELKVRNPCWLFEVDLEKLLQYSPSRFTYRDLSRFPAVARDVAVVADEGFASDRLVRFVREWNKVTRLIDDVNLFDQYSGPPIPVGKKSLAYSISYRAPDRTLTDSEVNALHMELIAALKNALDVEPR